MGRCTHKPNSVVLLFVISLIGRDYWHRLVGLRTVRGLCDAALCLLRRGHDAHRPVSARQLRRICLSCWLFLPAFRRVRSRTDRRGLGPVLQRHRGVVRHHRPCGGRFDAAAWPPEVMGGDGFSQDLSPGGGGGRFRLQPNSGERKL